MIYLTADLHFNHTNIIRFCNRPFGDVETMNKYIIESWNKTVTPEDEVYILGDFSFKGTHRTVRYLMNRLNGKKYMIKGNHDRSKMLNNLQNAKLIEWWKYTHEIEYEYKGRKYTLSLSHYPHFPSKGSDIVCLHGHVHGIYEHHGTHFHSPGVIDVGVDNVGYSPISIETILDFIERQRNV